MMGFRTGKAWALLCLLAVPALAQDDDLLAPLPVKEAPKDREKAKAKPKAAKAKPKAQRAAPVSDDELAPLVPAKTELTVQVAASLRGARLFIDDKEVGTLPAGPKTVTPGEHTIMVKRVGYGTSTKKVTVPKGKTTEVTMVLEAVAGVLSVESEVAGAAVWVNDKRIGVTPLREHEISPGPAEVRVKKDNYRDASEVITVRAGKEYSLSLTPTAAVAAVTPVTAVPDRPAEVELAPKPELSQPSSPLEVTDTAPVEGSDPVYKRWYFWVGVAAVVAAGTTTAVLMTRGPGLPNKTNAKDWCRPDATCYYWELPSPPAFGGSFGSVMR